MSVLNNPWVRAPLALAALAAAGVGEWALLPYQSADYARAMTAWAIAGALFLPLMLTREGRALPDDDTPLPGRVEWPLFAAVLLVGIGFRVFRLDILPPGLNHDVAWNGLYALRILHGEPYTPYAAEAWGRETLMFYFQAIGVKLLGNELMAMVLPAVIAGILLLPVAYFMARELFGPRVALATMLLLGMSGWHVVFSRVGWRAVLQPLISGAGYVFLLRALRTNRSLDYALAGTGAAGAIYTYNAARPVALFFPLYVLYRFALGPDRLAFLRRSWKGLAVMLVTYVVVVFPMAHYAYFNWVKWQGRAWATLWLEGRTLGGNLASALFMYLQFGNGDDFFIQTPLLEVPAAVLLCFGVAWCLFNLLDHRAAFLLLGLAVNLVPAVVTNPNGNRAVGTMPFVYTCIALGAVFFARELRRVPRAGTALAGVFAAVVTVASGVFTYREFLGPERREIFGFYPETTVLGRYMKNLAPQYSIWVGGANFPRDTLTFLMYREENYRGGNDGGRLEIETQHFTWVDEIAKLPAMDISPEPGKGVALIVATHDRGPLVFDELRRLYPVHEIVELRDWSKQEHVFARVLLLSAEAIAARQPGMPRPKPTPPLGADLYKAKRGSGPGEFLDPKGIAVSRQGDIYVADTGNHRIHKFSKTGALVATWGERGATPGNFDEPNALALDPAGNVHVVDTWNHRVQKLAPDGTVLATYAPPNGFFGPRGVAISTDRVYVTDSGNNSIAVFDLDGKFQSRFGAEGGGDGQLLQPVGIAVAKDTVWVVDGGNNRLQAFTADGKFSRAVPVPGWTGSGIKEAALLALADGTVILPDIINGRVIAVPPKGDLKVVSDQQLFGPCGIAVGPEGGLLITERAPARVSKIAYEGARPAVAAPQSGKKPSRPARR